MIILIGKLGKGESCGDFYVFLCGKWGEKGKASFSMNRTLKMKNIDLDNYVDKAPKVIFFVLPISDEGKKNSIKSQQSDSS